MTSHPTKGNPGVGFPKPQPSSIREPKMAHFYPRWNWSPADKARWVWYLTESDESVRAIYRNPQWQVSIQGKHSTPLLGLRLLSLAERYWAAREHQEDGSHHKSAWFRSHFITMSRRLPSPDLEAPCIRAWGKLPPRKWHHQGHWELQQQQINQEDQSSIGKALKINCHGITDQKVVLTLHAPYKQSDCLLKWEIKIGPRVS